MTSPVRNVFLLFTLLASSLSAATPDPGLIAASVAADAGDDRMLIAWTTTLGVSSRIRAAVVDLANAEVVAELEMPLRGPSPDHPAVSFDGTAFLLAWVDGTEIRGMRISAEGSMLDAEPILIADDTLPHPPALAWNGEAWVAAWSARAGWIGLESRIQLRRIPPQGELLDAVPVMLPPAPFSSSERRPQIDCNGTDCLVVAFAQLLDPCARGTCPPAANALALWVVDRFLTPRSAAGPSSLEFGYVQSFDLAWGRDAWLLVWGTQFARRIGPDGLALEPMSDSRLAPSFFSESAHVAVLGDGAGWRIVRDSRGPWPLLTHDTEWSRDGTWTPQVAAVVSPPGSAHPRLVGGADPWLVWTVTRDFASEIAFAPLDRLVGPALTFGASVERTGDQVRVTWENPPGKPFEFQVETLEWSHGPYGGPFWRSHGFVAATERSAAFRLNPDEITSAIRVRVRYEGGGYLYSTPVSLAKRRAVGR